MRRIDFPEWREVLTQAELPERLKSSFEITIRWYLSFCQRGRAQVTVQSARDFIAWAVDEKHPQSWQVEHWKEAIRWFFRAARDEPQETAQDQRPVEPDQPVWLPEDRTGWPEWKVAFLTTIRRRNYSVCPRQHCVTGRRVGL
jgi:hypothetical protein